LLKRIHEQRRAFGVHADLGNERAHVFKTPLLQPRRRGQGDCFISVATIEQGFNQCSRPRHFPGCGERASGLKTHLRIVRVEVEGRGHAQVSSRDRL